MPREVRYAWNGDVSLAYETVGTGPVDLLILAGAPANLDLQWENATYASFLHRLAEGRRLILTDRRGTGCPTASPPPSQRPSNRSPAISPTCSMLRGPIGP